MKYKLSELRAEFERGQQQMAALEQRRAELRETMLRISGAIQVLEELLEKNPEDSMQNGRADVEADRSPAFTTPSESVPA